MNNRVLKYVGCVPVDVEGSFMCYLTQNDDKIGEKGLARLFAGPVTAARKVAMRVYNDKN